MKIISAKLKGLKNPFPSDVFIEPTTEQYKLFHKLLQKKGLTLDKFAGAVGRRVWDNCIEESNESLKESLERIFEEIKKIDSRCECCYGEQCSHCYLKELIKQILIKRHDIKFEVEKNVI